MTGLPLIQVFDGLTRINLTGIEPASPVEDLGDAPLDGKTYGRMNATWVQVLPISGGALTNFLTLNADPTSALHAATKQYVDNLSGRVRYDAAQTLTAVQKKQVIANTGSHKGYFWVNRNGVNQTGVSAGFNKIQMNNEVVDAQSWFDAVTNFRYQPNEPGYYYFHLAVAQIGAGSSETCQAAISKNASNVAVGTYAPTGFSSWYSQVDVIVALNGSTDYVEAAMYVPTGVTAIAGNTATTFFLGWKIGEL